MDNNGDIPFIALVVFAASFLIMSYTGYKNYIITDHKIKKINNYNNNYLTY